MSERDWTKEETEWPKYVKGMDGEQYTQQLRAQVEEIMRNIKIPITCCADPGDCDCGNNNA